MVCIETSPELRGEHRKLFLIPCGTRPSTSRHQEPKAGKAHAGICICLKQNKLDIPELPAMKNLGLLDQAAFHKEVARSRVLVGVGRPYM